MAAIFGFPALHIPADLFALVVDRRSRSPVTGSSESGGVPADDDRHAWRSLSLSDSALLTDANVNDVLTADGVD